MTASTQGRRRTWELYGCAADEPAYLTSEEVPRPVWILRDAGGRAQLRTYSDGVVADFGMEHPSVAGAICWAFFKGCIDPRDLLLSVAAIVQVREDAGYRTNASDRTQGSSYPYSARTAEGDRGDIPASAVRSEVPA